MTDPFLSWDIAFSGDNLVIEATSYDYDTDLAEFDLYWLYTVMQQFGCDAPE